MSSRAPAKFSFLYRQESLIAFGLCDVFDGVYNVSFVRMRLTYLTPGVYATLVAFLVYYFCECLGYATIKRC
jgi:hypothetical protein